GQPQQGSSAHAHTLAGSRPCGRFATVVEGELALFGRQALCPTRGRSHQSRKPLSKDGAGTGRIAAKELADMDGQPHRRGGPGQVSDRAIVVAMDGARALATQWATRLGLCRGKFEVNALLGRRNGVQTEVRQPRKQEIGQHQDMISSKATGSENRNLLLYPVDDQPASPKTPESPVR